MFLYSTTATEQGQLDLLRKLYVDTGMGLERIASVLQKKHSNYDTDLFHDLFQTMEKITGHAYDQAESSTKIAMRVIVDHIRAICFAMADGVVPSNEGRGYVIRRLIRRALYYGMHVLGINDFFLHQLKNTLRNQMNASGLYEELQLQDSFIHETLKQEGALFRDTLNQGMIRFEQKVKSMQQIEETVVSGKDAFVLYDTYGFPLDLTMLLAREKNLTIDQEAFHQHMLKQKDQSRLKGAESAAQQVGNLHSQLQETRYLGAEETENKSVCTAKLLAIIVNKKQVQTLSDTKGACWGYLVFDQTVLYAEGGGQVADTGFIGMPQDDTILQSYERDRMLFPFEETRKVMDQFQVGIWVKDVKKIGGVFLHEVEVLWGQVVQKDTYCLLRYENRRQRIRRAHTATHLLHSALRDLFGSYHSSGWFFGGGG